MAIPASTSPDRLARVGIVVAFGLVTILNGAGVALTVLAGAPLWPNSVAAMVFYAFPVVGLLIAFHRPRNAIGWLCITVGVLWALEGALWGTALYGLARPGTVARPELLAAIGDALVVPGLFLMATLLLLLFPDGRLPSPRWRWLAWLSAVSIATGYISALFGSATSGWGRPNLENPLAVEAVTRFEPFIIAMFFVAFFCVVASVVALVGRFWNATGMERLQLRWLMAAGACVIVVWFFAIVAVEPLAGENAAVAAIAASFALIPAAIGVAVLRYRLYDIDRIISRTVTYALLTAGLGAIYFGLVVGLQELLRPLTGSNDSAIVVTTLVVAALFLPARRRVQDAVDRRFNRRTYDAAQTIEAFSARLREQIDLDTIRHELLAIVDETMEPATASLWLRTPESQR